MEYYAIIFRYRDIELKAQFSGRVQIALCSAIEPFCGTPKIDIDEVNILIQEFFRAFIVALLAILIIGYIGQRLLVNKSKLDSKTIKIMVVQSLVIALLYAFII